MAIIWTNLTDKTQLSVISIDKIIGILIRIQGNQLAQVWIVLLYHICLSMIVFILYFLTITKISNINIETQIKRKRAGKPKTLTFMRIDILWEIDTAIDVTGNRTRSRNLTSRTKLACRKWLSTNHVIKDQGYCLPKGSCCSTGENWRQNHEKFQRKQQLQRLGLLTITTVTSEVDLLSHTVRGSHIFKKPETDPKRLSHIILGLWKG